MLNLISSFWGKSNRDGQEVAKKDAHVGNELLGITKKDAHGGNGLLGNAKKDAHVGVEIVGTLQTAGIDTPVACIPLPSRWSV